VYTAAQRECWAHHRSCSERQLVYTARWPRARQGLAPLARGALQKRAARRAADIVPIIAALRQAGATSLRAIADGLNAQAIPTARGSGEWSPTQVARVIERL